MAIDEVNERSIKVVNVAFTDEDGTAVTPTSASYRIDDVGSGTQVRDDTAISIVAPDTSADIILDATDTSILDEFNLYETKRVTFSWEYATETSPSVTGTGTHEYLINVINLAGVTTPSPA